MINKENNKKWLTELSKEKLAELLLMHVRDLWSLDGLYFVGIEDKFSTEDSTEIDRGVWEVMGKLEARRLKETLEIKDDSIQSLVKLLTATSWLLDLDNVELLEEKNKVIVRNRSCRVQGTRLSKGRGEFPCKDVRVGFFKSFAKEFNPKIEVRCNICPPDKHPENLWCEWEFLFG